MKTSLPESMLFRLTRFLMRLVFRAEVRGLENYPKGGRRLVIATHASWLDAALLAAFLPDKRVFAVHTQIARMRRVKPFLRPVKAEVPR
jgi:acyl-[acyl-carrier-protein]-phospholipid O-acyltransferase/long-chain-fatty-acid--[acyl-carrier-protein] ligase